MMCKSLRLAYMAEIYEDIAFENPTQFLESLLSKELELRESIKVERLIKKARFLQVKSVATFQWHDQIHFLPQLNAEELKRLNFIKSRENLILTGYVPFSTEGAELFFQLISDWYEQKSLIITSNLEFSQWNRIFADSRLTAALVDRVIHHAHILNFTGDSFRITHALSRNNYINLAGKLMYFFIAILCTFSLQNTYVYKLDLNGCRGPSLTSTSDPAHFNPSPSYYS